MSWRTHSRFTAKRQGALFGSRLPMSRLTFPMPLVRLGGSRNRRFPQGGIKRWLRRSLKLKLIEFIYRHTIVTSESLALPRMATRKCGGSESNTRRIDHKSSVLTTMLPSHTYYMFVPIDFEKTGVPSFSTGQLLSNLGRRLAESSGESRETGFRGARSWCSVVTVLLHNGLPALDGKDW